jgi:hypothetical protein
MTLAVTASTESSFLHAQQPVTGFYHQSLGTSFVVITTALLNYQVFCSTTQIRPVNIYGLFEGTHSTRRNISEEMNLQNPVRS